MGFGFGEGFSTGTVAGDLAKAKTLYDKLLVAAYWNDVPLAAELIAQGAPVNPDPNAYVSTPLYYAACDGSLNLAKLLVKNHANVNQGSTANLNNMPLLIAISKGHLSMIAFLLEKNANVNYVSERGENALDQLLSKRFLYDVEFMKDAFKLLFKAGLNLSINGQTPMDRVFHYGERIANSTLSDAEKEEHIELIEQMLLSPDSMLDNRPISPRIKLLMEEKYSARFFLLNDDRQSIVPQQGQAFKRPRLGSGGE